MADSTPLQARLLQELVVVMNPVRTALDDAEPVEALLQLMADAFVDGELLFGRNRIEQWQPALQAAWQTVANLDASDFEPARLPATVTAVTDLLEVVTELAQEPVAPEADLTAEEAIRRLADHLVGRYLKQHRPTLEAALTMLRVRSPADSEVGRSVVLHLDRIAEWVSDPESLRRAVIGWGTPEFDPGLYVRALATAMDELGLAGRVEEEHPLALEPALSFPAPVPHTAAAYLLLLALDQPALLRFGLRVQASPPSQAGDDAGFALSPFGNVGANAEQPLDEDGDWLVDVTLDGQLSGQPFLSLRPGAAGLVEDDGVLSGTLTARLRRSAVAEPLEGFDVPGLRLGLGYPALSLDVRADGGELGLSVTVGTEEASLSLSPPDGDGFLSSLLPEPVTQHFGLTLGWDTERGFFIGKGTSLALALPLSPDGGGVLTLRTAHVAVAAPESLRVEVTVDGTARLGPLAVTLEGIGLAGSIDLTDPLASLQPDLRFRPPHGAGLTLETGPVTGGGFLAHDADAGRYTGALEVTVGELGLSAFGIVDTRAPGGADGFSMVAVVAGRFAPIPIGFGFTLNGVGGVLGVHRDVDVDALFAAVRAGTAGEILTPEDPVGDAPRLAEEIGTLFPVHRGQHVFGPTMKLGWGSPAELVSLDLALVLTLPDPLRLVLVGTVRAVLPDADLAVARLNVDVAGVLDLSASRFEMEGRVYDSVIQALPVTGGFAMRTSWGRDTSFAFAIGGLHPGFTPPARFPDVDRMGVDLSRGSSFQFRLAGYFAITSNSLQLGARADLKAREGGMSLLADVAFDALLIIDPFELDVAVSAGASIKRGSTTLCSIRLKGRLRGPGPWRVSGSVSISILFLEISIGFSVSFGQSRDALAEAVDAGALIAEAVAAHRSWVHGFATRGDLVLDGLDGQTLVPDAPLAVQQKVAPLELELDRLGGRHIRGPRHFAIRRLEIGGQHLTPSGSRTEAFAPAQFLDMPERERLAAPSFEDMLGGATFAGDEVVDTGERVTADTSAETIILDAPPDLSLPVFRVRREMRVRPHGVTAGFPSPSPAPTGAVSVRPEPWTATDGALSTIRTGTYAHLRGNEPDAVLARAGEVT